MMCKPIITIDGPAGTGKTTVAKRVAEKLRLPYFDTGAMYRSVTFLLLKEKIPLSDTPRIEQLLRDFHFEMRGHRYFANGIDVTEEIRSPAVTSFVSPVAALAPVRQALWEIQRRFAKKQGGVFEGRDMGSVVFPKARYKIFLTARAEVRAARRLAELPGTKSSEEMLAEIQQRDAYDSTRALAPLVCPPDAYTIDSSDLTIDQVVDNIVAYRRQKKTIPSWMQWRVPFLYRLIVFFSWCIGKFFFRLKVYGLEHYYPGGAILAANHTSFFDPPVVAVSWPEEVHFLARDTLFKNWLFGALIRNVNSHPVGRDSADIGAIKTVCALLEAGKKVVLFPEGTRSKDGELQPLKPGMGMLVVRTQTAVIPIYIDGAYEVWGRGQKWPKLFRKVVCVFGRAITAQSFSHLDKKEAQGKIGEELSKTILRLKKWYREGAEGIPP